MVRCAFSSLAGSLAVTASALLFSAQAGRAEILVQGDATDVRLEATQAPVDEILVALGKTYNVRYRTTIALDRPITGTYSGPLSRVIARVLEGYDYVARVTSDGVDIPYIRTRGSVPPATTTVSVKPVILPMEVGELRRLPR